MRGTPRDLHACSEDFAPHVHVAEDESEKEDEVSRRVVSILGLGNMGESMARNIVLSGDFDEVRVWNRTQDTAQSFAVSVEDVHRRGSNSSTAVTVCNSPREAAEGAQVSMLCLGTESACKTVLLDPESGILTAKDGTQSSGTSVVIDHSTVSPGLSQKCHDLTEDASDGVMFLDGPVSGGPEGASDGTLSIMCGGENSAFHIARPVLECMGDEGEFFVAGIVQSASFLFRSQSCLHSSSRLRPLFVSRHRPSPVVHMGPAGAGTAAKLVNQLLVGVHATASSEALALAKALDLDLGPGSKLLPLLAASWGQSRVLERNGAVIASADGDFASRDLESSGAPLRNLVKDMEIIIDAARNDLDLRAAEVATAVYKHYAKTGFGGADMAIAARYDAFRVCRLEAASARDHARPELGLGGYLRRWRWHLIKTY